jgi:hypothetical protein
MTRSGLIVVGIGTAFFFTLSANGCGGPTGGIPIGADASSDQHTGTGGAGFGSGTGGNTGGGAGNGTGNAGGTSGSTGGRSGSNAGTSGGVGGTSGGAGNTWDAASGASVIDAGQDGTGCLAGSACSMGNRCERACGTNNQGRLICLCDPVTNRYICSDTCSAPDGGYQTPQCPVNPQGQRCGGDGQSRCQISQDGGPATECYCVDRQWNCRTPEPACPAGTASNGTCTQRDQTCVITSEAGRTTTCICRRDDDELRWRCSR